MKSAVRGGSVLLRRQQLAVKLLGRLWAGRPRSREEGVALQPPSRLCCDRPAFSAQPRGECGVGPHIGTCSAGERWVGRGAFPSRCDPLCLPTKCCVQLKFNVLTPPSPIHLTVPDTCPSQAWPPLHSAWALLHASGPGEGYSDPSHRLHFISSVPWASLHSAPYLVTLPWERGIAPKVEAACRAHRPGAEL